MAILLAELKNCFQVSWVNVQEPIAAAYRFLLAFTPIQNKKQVR